MDSSQGQSSQRARPPYPRASSRSSTSTTHTRMTSQSANSSTSQLPSSPQLSSSYPAHRLHHNSGINPGSPLMTPRHTPQLSREGSIESTRQHAVSSFLQEKLQRERRVEGDKLIQGPVLSRLNTDLSASMELGSLSQQSPMRSSQSESSRPRSSVGGETSKKPGLGVKDMEHVISTLHKQNFDLKLELFHRREKQTAMETQIETLETDKREVGEMNDTLMVELEKRDKAVEEAVAMIVMLEARVDQLMSERAMVQQMERDAFLLQHDLHEKYVQPHMEAPVLDNTAQHDDARSITRMPSFLSERSGNTENLRNVYLGVKGSALSLPKVAEGPSDDSIPANGLASPTLSVLSESSFASVYGKKSEDRVFPPPVHILSLDGMDTNRMEQADDYTNTPKGPPPPVVPVRAATANSFLRGAHISGPLQSITGVVGRESPLQQIEKLDRPYGVLQEGFRPVANQARDRRDSQPASSNGRRLTKEEKREALKKVMTEAPGGVRLNEQNFPPTPDTISTSTLHRMRSSEDSIAQQKEARNEQIAAIYHSLEDQSSGASLKDQPRLMPSPAKTREVRNSQIYDNMAQRPRSASETTVSHRQEQGWDSDDESDVRSLESSLDIWMRESTKPSRKGGRVSPDLFGFPTSASNGGWSTNSMFGANSVRPAQGIGADADYMRDLFAVRQALFPGQSGPSPPDRRSSLHARTGSRSGSIRMVENSPKPAKPASQHNSPDTRGRHGHARQRSENLQPRSDMRTPVQQQSAPPPQPSSEQKKNHYPPIVGQQAPRTGLNRLFRRSLVGTPKAPESPASVVEAPVADASKNGQTQNSSHNVGIPCWVNRNVAVEDDERTGATPPPIMLNPRQMRRNTAGAETMQEFIPPSASAPAELSEVANTGRQTPTLAKQATVQAAPAPSATGMRRKWLPGFAKSASGLKNRAG